MNAARSISNFECKDSAAPQVLQLSLAIRIRTLIDHASSHLAVIEGDNCRTCAGYSQTNSKRGDSALTLVALPNHFCGTPNRLLKKTGESGSSGREAVLPKG